MRLDVLDQKVGSVDTESPDAATEVPCCSMPCHVVHVTRNFWRVISTANVCPVTRHFGSVTSNFCLGIGM